MTCPLSSTGITPLHHYYGAVRPYPAHRYFWPRGCSHLSLLWAFYCQAVSERRSLFLAFFIGFFVRPGNPVSSPRPAALQSRRAQELSRLAVAPTFPRALDLPGHTGRRSKSDTCQFRHRQRRNCYWISRQLVECPPWLACLARSRTLSETSRRVADAAGGGPSSGTTRPGRPLSFAFIQFSAGFENEHSQIHHAERSDTRRVGIKHLRQPMLSVQTWMCRARRAADSTSRPIEADVEVGGADSGSMWFGLSSRSGPGGTDDCSGAASPRSPESSSFEIAAGKAHPRIARNKRRLTTPQKALMSCRYILPLVHSIRSIAVPAVTDGRHFPGLGHNRQVSSDGFSGFSAPNPRFCGASLCPPFSNFRFGLGNAIHLTAS